MYALSFRRRRGARGVFRRGGSRREEVLVTEPAVAVETDPALVAEAAPVSDVVAVEPVEKTYRATVIRTITQTAVVEFIATEGTDTYSMAEELLKQIPEDAWVDQPSEGYGYIDRIEEVEAIDPAAVDPLADPLAAPAALSRRYSKRSTYMVSSGQYAAYDDQAIWGVGASPDAALEDAKQWLDPTTPDENEQHLAAMKTAEMTQALATQVASSGGNVSFELTSSGLLGVYDEEYLAEEEAAAAADSGDPSFGLL